MRLAKLIPVLVILLPGGNIRAQEKTKAFPQWQCQYTLPGDDWSWEDPTADPGALCVARNRDGLFVTVRVGASVPPPGTVIDGEFAADFDQGAGRHLLKRRGSFLQFRGLPCYEFEGIGHGDTVVIRSVVANGRHYMVKVIGDADWAKRRPEFEAAMDGFEFTAPPVPPVALPRKGYDPATDLRDQAIVILLIVGFIACCRRAFRRD